MSKNRTHMPEEREIEKKQNSNKVRLSKNIAQ
jgi:hypothetical protein